MTEEECKWVVSVETDVDDEYYIQLPEDLLEKTGWTENDELEWIENGDSSFTLRKVKFDPYENEMIAAGYEMIGNEWVLSK